MAGRVQLATSGPQDIFFTEDPEYTYFIKNFKKHTNFSTFFVDLDVDGEVEFGNNLRCTIPQNQGDLLKTLSFKIELSPINQSLVGGTDGTRYNESIGHAMFEYVELFIGGQLIQRIPRNFLQIYSELYVTQTNQTPLATLIGKPPGELSGSKVNGSDILGYLPYATTDTKYFVDIPFYFYNNPELAIPLCAINKQEVEIVFKLANSADCYHYQETSGGNLRRYGVEIKNLIKSLKVTAEMVCLDEPERAKLQSKKIDYIVTQIQENTFDPLPREDNHNTFSEATYRLNFVNPVKELFFVIQKVIAVPVPSRWVSAFDWDHTEQILNTGSSHSSAIPMSRYINYENLHHLSLTLDGETILDEDTGSLINLRAVQSGIHHSRTPLYRRFYSYSFSLEPERWYPTGQKNFSFIKNQNLKIKINPHVGYGGRGLRVYALSYNILRIENGISKILFIQ